jgi:hypothetical protein
MHSSMGPILNLTAPLDSSDVVFIISVLLIFHAPCAPPMTPPGLFGPLSLSLLVSTLHHPRFVGMDFLLDLHHAPLTTTLHPASSRSQAKRHQSTTSVLHKHLTTTHTTQRIQLAVSIILHIFDMN